MQMSNVWKLIQEQIKIKIKKHLQISKRSSQQLALQISPQVAHQQGPSFCLPSGGQQLTAPDHLQEAP